MKRKCPNCDREKPVKEFRRKNTHTGELENDYLMCNDCMGIFPTKDFTRLDLVDWLERKYPQVFLEYARDLFVEGKLKDEYDEHCKLNIINK